MNSRQFAQLEKHIQRWIDEACEDPDWPSVIVGSQTVPLMAIAARSVFDACEESQAYAQHEGYMKASA